MSIIMGTDYLEPADVDLSGFSNNPARRGDFIGFTFDGTHSSELGIVRVSDGSRFQETLLPELSNKTVNVPGSNRTDYLGMEYTQKPINLNIAFDAITEKQLRDIKRIFSATTPKSLIFDETPYKTYYVKASAPPTLSYICFDETQQRGEPRIYKGEGTINLISFFPYGFCSKDNINEFFDFNGEPNEQKYQNIKEWLIASGLDQFSDKSKDTTFYNPGDFETPFWIEIDDGSLSKGSIKIGEYYLEWEASSNMNDNFPIDTKIIIDGRNQLIEGYAGNQKSGRIYNKFIKNGNWFNIPIGNNDKYEIDGIQKIKYNILYI